MLLLPYDKNHHLSHMLKLLEGQNVTKDVIHDLPEHGLIAFEDGIPVAAGFLRMMEGTYVMMDSYIVAKDAKLKVKHRAVMAITNKLISWTMTHGITKVLCFSKESGIIKCARRAGFKDLSEHKSMIYLVNS